MVEASVYCPDGMGTVQRNVKWWGMVLVFQVVFGSVVFLLTRAYYLPPETQPAASLPSGSAGLPKDHPALGSQLRPYPLASVNTNPATLLDNANSAYQKKEYETAADLYARALEYDPDNVGVLNNLGLTLFYLGRTEEALQQLTRGTESDPNMQRIWLTLGFVRSNSGQITQAREALEKAVDLDAENQIGKEARRMLEQLN